jgi:hypothetical protein
MGRGLSPLQKDILKHAQEHGRILPSQALDIAFDHGKYLSDNPWTVGKAVASQALRRLVNRGLLLRHRCRFVGYPTFYHLPTVEPVERDPWGRTEEERAIARAEHDARQQTKSMLNAEDAVEELRTAFAALQGSS